jgi:hypothetical protein
MQKNTEPSWIFNRWTDLSTVGGVALLVLLPLLLFPSVEGFLTGAMLASSLHIAINFPHFIASYRIIYASKERILRYKSATIFMPLLLFAACIFALMQSFENGLYVHLLVVASGLYIGIHYTGQTWGMMAVHAHLAKRPFNVVERRLIRTGLYALAFFHASFFMRFSAQLTGAYLEAAALCFNIGQVAASTGFVAAAIGILLYTKRQQSLPPSAVLLAWISIYVWYAVFSSLEAGVFWVQVAHSLQYLIFPARMFVNEQAASVPVKKSWVVYLQWYIPLLLGGVFAFHLVPTIAIYGLAEFSVTTEVKNEVSRLIPIVVSAFLNIHHYFTDGCIWKMRDPKVRESLFAHLYSKKVTFDSETKSLPEAS